MFNEVKDLSVLKEHPARKGFYRMDRYPLIYISLNQEILDSRTDIILMAYVGYYDYLKVDVSGLNSGILLHRAMAETFLDSGGQDPRKYQVNHKDGDKLNCEISNLEFVTRSQNTVHAFKTGLRTDNRAVLCKDLRTGVITRYYSMNECSRRIASNQGYLSNYLKGPRNVPVMGVYEVIMEGDEWKGFDESLILPEPTNRFIDVAVVSENGTRIKIYRTITATARESGISVARLTKILKDRVHTPVDGNIYLELSDLKKVFPGKEAEVVSLKKMPRGRKPPKPITVYDHDTGTSSKWVSTGKFAEHHGVDKKTIQKSMGLKQGRWCNFTITYDR